MTTWRQSRQVVCEFRLRRNSDGGRTNAGRLRREAVCRCDLRSHPRLGHGVWLWVILGHASQFRQTPRPAEQLARRVRTRGQRKRLGEVWWLGVR